MKKIVLIVMDSMGVGALPDAELADQGAATLPHILLRKPELALPNMERLGFLNIDGMFGRRKEPSPTAVYGRACEKSAGKDSIVGHWELMCLPTYIPFLTYSAGFPEDIISEFTQLIGRPVLGNRAESGTQIIKELGAEHMMTKSPIVYTSADSVFQIAAHEDVVPLEQLYAWCEAARKMFDRRGGMGRIIARPFIGDPESGFTRTEHRRDYAAIPPGETAVERLKKAGVPVVGIGKTGDIFSGRGFDSATKTKSNTEGIAMTIEKAKEMKEGFIFTNLLDYDMLYGHRRDVDGYANALAEFDEALPKLTATLREGDLLIITADHGCDPTQDGSDHTREYIPVVITGPGVVPRNLGTLESFADVGATVLAFFGQPLLEFGNPIALGKGFVR